MSYSRPPSGRPNSHSLRQPSYDGYSIARKPLPSPSSPTPISPQTSPQSAPLFSPVQQVSTSRSLRPPTAVPVHSRNNSEHARKSSEARVSEVPFHVQTEPKTLGQHAHKPPKPVTPGWKRPPDVLKVLVGLLLPIPFYVLAIAVARLDGRDANDDDFARFYTAMKLTVSIFPVVYALVVGRAMSSVAAYKLERSSRLGTLERLLGSISLGSTINTVMSLGIIHSVTPFVLVIWALSPIGGQAAINIVSIQPAAIFGQRAIPYFSTEGSTLFQSGDLGFQSELNAIYAASVFAPLSIRESPMDLWGNVKIPYLSAFSEHDQADSDGWYAVGNNTLSSLQYSSLIGLPVLVNMTEGENTTMSMLSSYLEFDCDPVQNGDDNIEVRSLSSGLNFGNGTWYTDTNSNNTFMLALNGMNNETFAPYVQPAFIQNKTLTQPEQWKLLFHGGPGNGSNWGHTQCSISQVYVESSVLCAGKTCSVQRIRPSTARHPKPWNTDFACSLTFSWFVKSFVPALGTYPSNVHAGASGSAEQYLATGSVASGWGVSAGWFNFNASGVSSTADFSARLGHLINTYWHASYEPGAFHGNTTALANIDNPVQIENQTQFDLQPRALRHVTAQTQQWRRAYVVSKAWLAVFLVATTAMWLAALLSALLLSRQRGPRILGSVASVLRDARYAHLPPNLRDSTANWDQLAREGKDLRLCLADVKPHSDTGHIAIQVCESDRPIGPISKQRYYD